MIYIMYLSLYLCIKVYSLPVHSASWPVCLTETEIMYVSMRMGLQGLDRRFFNQLKQSSSCLRISHCGQHHMWQAIVPSWVEFDGSRRKREQILLFLTEIQRLIEMTDFGSTSKLWSCSWKTLEKSCNGEVPTFIPVSFHLYKPSKACQNKRILAAA